MFTLPTAPKPPVQALRQDGLSLLTPSDLAATLPAGWTKAWPALASSWDHLPPDAHLKDGGHYRRRRHSCYVQQLGAGRAWGVESESRPQRGQFLPDLQAHSPAMGQKDGEKWTAAVDLQPTIPKPDRLPDSGQLLQVAHRAHWQPTDYNAMHGGFERWFEPVEPAVAGAPAWSALLTGLGQLFAQVHPAQRWYIEAHQFRIDTVGGVGRPTPEGAHRDGVDFVVVMLVARQGVKGGETRVFDAHGPHGLRFVMQEPLTALLLDDSRVIHETTPILPLDAAMPTGYRDTLVLTYRAAGFQAP